jgi:hypothetical protein
MKIFWLLISVILINACYAHLPGEGGFRVTGSVQSREAPSIDSFTIEVHFSDTGKVHKVKRIENHFNEFFFASPDMHEYYFVLRSGSHCYKSGVYKLGQMEQVNLGAIVLNQCGANDIQK